MVLSLLFILLLHYIAGVLLWLVIFGVIGAVGYGKYLLCVLIDSGCCVLHMKHNA